MARHYKRKTAPVDPQKMEKALSAVKNGTKLATAARQCGVHRTTLRRHVKLPPKKQSNQVFTHAQEAELKKYLRKSDDMDDGLTYQSIRKFAYQFAVKWKVKMPPSWRENGLAGKDWMYTFRRRHRDLPLQQSMASRQSSILPALVQSTPYDSDDDIKHFDEVASITYFSIDASTTNSFSQFDDTSDTCDDPLTSVKHMPENDFNNQSKYCQTEPEDDNLKAFFCSLANTMRTFPKIEIAKLKLEMSKLVGQKEIELSEPAPKNRQRQKSMRESF